MQLFYNLSDPGMEDMLYEIESVRRFAGLRLTGPLPDEDDDSELSAPAGAARAGAWFVRGDQRAPGGAGLPGAGGDDRGREHHRGAVIDEEPGGGAGSGDASDKEGQRVALRDEGAHRGGRGDGTGAWRAGDAGAHARSSGGGGVASRRRGGGVGGRGLPGIEKWVDTGGRPVQWHVAMRPGQRRLLEQGGARWLRERDKASVRAKVEHPFLYVKRRFGYRKVATAGWPRTWNGSRCSWASANLLVAGRYSTA